MASQSRAYIEYTVGLVCTRAEAFDAAVALLDEEHPALPYSLIDPTKYTLGRISQHNVVLIYPLHGDIKHLLPLFLAFRSLRFVVMVGLGEGVEGAVNLGDVVISDPENDLQVPVPLDAQLEYRTSQQDGVCIRTRILSKLSAPLRTVLASLKELHQNSSSKIQSYLKLLGDSRPSSFVSRGYLYRNLEAGRVHCGPVVISNHIIEDASFRHKVCKPFTGKYLCYDMEAAWLMDDFPCFVVRGICKIANALNNKYWYEYATLIAVAASKELLSVITSQQVKEMPTIEGKSLLI